MVDVKQQMDSSGNLWRRVTTRAKARTPQANGGGSGEAVIQHEIVYS